MFFAKNIIAVSRYDGSELEEKINRQIDGLPVYEEVFFMVN